MFVHFLRRVHLPSTFACREIQKKAENLKVITTNELLILICSFILHIGEYSIWVGWGGSVHVMHAYNCLSHQMLKTLTTEDCSEVTIRYLSARPHVTVVFSLIAWHLVF